MNQLIKHPCRGRRPLVEGLVSLRQAKPAAIPASAEPKPQGPDATLRSSDATSLRSTSQASPDPRPFYAFKDDGVQDRLITLGRIISEVGHELRNPLAVIGNSVYFLRMAIPHASKKVRRHLEIIDWELDIAHNVISTLLDFSRNSSAYCVPTPVGPLILDVLETMRLPETVELLLDLPKDFPPAQMDPVSTSRILVNLLSNAIEAMPDGGCLRIIAWSEDDCVAVGVSDTGCGIPPEAIEEIFQPLVTTKKNGFGLGLTASRYLARAQGGDITVESQVGRGSTFRLTFSRASEGGFSR